MKITFLHLRLNFSASLYLKRVFVRDCTHHSILICATVKGGDGEVRGGGL